MHGPWGGYGRGVLLFEVVFEVLFSVVIRGIGLAVLSVAARIANRRRPPPTVSRDLVREDETLADFIGVITLLAVGLTVLFVVVA